MVGTLRHIGGSLPIQIAHGEALMALYPLHRKFRVTRMFAASYQADFGGRSAGDGRAAPAIESDDLGAADRT